MVEIDKSEIAEIEIYFALDDNGQWGFGADAEAARDMLMNDFSDEGTAIRSFSVRVRARKPGVELGPEIDIADRDTEVATVAEGGGNHGDKMIVIENLPEASRSSQQSS
jgi:hypothetical protein